MPSRRRFGPFSFENRAPSMSALIMAGWSVFGPAISSAAWPDDTTPPADCSGAPSSHYSFTNEIDGLGMSPGWSAKLQFYKKRSASPGTLCADPNPATSTCDPEDGDLWIRTYYNGAAQFDFKIGGGGAISELRGFYYNQTQVYSLLAPPSCSESTDKVVQAVFWDNGIGLRPDIKTGWKEDPANNIHLYSLRLWNINQAGTANQETPGTCPATNATEIYSPVANVQAAYLGNSVQVDVYSTPTDQWVPTVGKHMAGKVSMLTRYKVVGPGALMIRRVMLLGETTYEGLVFTKPNQYTINANNPLRLFDGTYYPYGYETASIAFDSTGAPTQDALTTATGYALTAENIPSGYVVAHRAGSAASTSPTMGVVFGNKAMKGYDAGLAKNYGNYYVNVTQASNAHALYVTPEIRWDKAATGGTAWPQQPVFGGIVDQYQLLFPGPGLSSSLKSDLDYYADKVPGPKYFGPCSVPYLDEPGVKDIAGILQANMKRAGMRTQHLRDAVYPYYPNTPPTTTPTPPANWPEDWP